MKITVSTYGQIVLPAEFRQQDGIAARHYLLKREVTGTNVGLLEWLRACPADDWLRPIPSEMTDVL